MPVSGLRALSYAQIFGLPCRGVNDALGLLQAASSVSIFETFCLLWKQQLFQHRPQTRVNGNVKKGH